MPRFAKRTSRHYKKRRFAYRRRDPMNVAGGGAAAVGYANRRPYRSGGFRKTYKWGVVGNLIPSTRLGPQQSLVRDHEYVEVKSLTSGALGVVGTTIQFSLSKPYQPNFTSADRKPNLFNQMAAQYNLYQVVAIKIRLTVITCDPNTVLCANITASSDSTSIAGLTHDLVAEKQWGVCMYPKGTSTAGMYESCSDETPWMTPAQLDGMGRLQNKLDTARYVGTSAGSGPSAIPKLEIGCADAPGSGSQTIRVVIEIIYKIQWEAPTVQAAST